MAVAGAPPIRPVRHRPSITAVTECRRSDRSSGFRCPQWRVQSNANPDGFSDWETSGRIEVGRPPLPLRRNDRGRDVLGLLGTRDGAGGRISRDRIADPLRRSASWSNLMDPRGACPEVGLQGFYNRVCRSNPDPDGEGMVESQGVGLQGDPENGGIWGRKRAT